MKTILFKRVVTFGVLIAMLVLPNLIFAQAGPPGGNPDDPDKKQQIEALKVAFISQQIDLTTSEAEKFWPIYNEFNAKRDEYAKVKRQLEKEARKNGLDNITDKQAEELLNADLKFEQQVLDLKKEYVEKYSAVIGIKKTARFFHAEREFNQFLLKQLKEANKPPKKP
jgi:regulator of protease activity HflC (stomatin/prohibitin superfamily)